MKKIVNGRSKEAKKNTYGTNPRKKETASVIENM